MKRQFIFIGLILVFVIGTAFAAANHFSSAEQQTQNEDLTLITDSPEEGFELALTLARKGVTSTQPDKEVLFMFREVYSKDPDALIASSQVVAIHFQTIAAANNYWRD